MLKTAAALGLLCAVAAALFFPVLFQGKILLPGDYLAHFAPWKSERPPDLQWNPLMWDALAQFYPWRLYYHRWVREGIIPLWNPHQFCGAPFLANLQSAILYPPNVAFVLMDPARDLGFSAALHILLAAIGAFVLARCLGVSRAGSAVSGSSFGFCTFLVAWAELPTVICTLAWLPWIFLGIERTFNRPSAIRAAVIALLLALCLLAGHLQMAFYCIMAAVLWAAKCCFFECKRDPRRVRVGIAVFAGAVVLAGLLASAQMLPTAELVGLSGRSGERTGEAFAGKMATLLQPGKLVVAFSPKFFGSPSDGNYCGVWNYAEHTMYIGVLGLFLALLGTLGAHRKGKWFFVALAALSITLASSKIANAVLYFGLPGYSSFGSPARILVLWCFSAAMLAGMGLDHVMGLTCRDARRITFPVCAAMFLAAWGVCALLARRGLPEGMPDPTVWQVAVSILVPGAAIILLTACRTISRRTGGILIAALVAADLLAANWGYNPTCRKDQVYPPVPMTNLLLVGGKFERILPFNDKWSMYSFPNAVLPPNSAMVYGFNDAQGYDSLFPGAYKAWLRDALDEDPSPIENGNMVFLKRPTQAALGLGRYVVSDRPVKITGLQEICSDPYIYEDLAVTRVSISKGYVESRPRGPNGMDIKARCPNAAVLRVNDAYFPGWHVYVDGSRAAFYSVGPTHMSCRLPSGDHNVRLRYEPASFRVGLHLSLAGLAILGGLLGYALAHRRTT